MNHPYVGWCRQCQESTSGDCGAHRTVWPNQGEVAEVPIQVGWRCPVCGRGNAPWNPTCQCVDVRTGQ